MSNSFQPSVLTSYFQQNSPTFMIASKSIPGMIHDYRVLFMDDGYPLGACNICHSVVTYLS